MNHVSFCMSKKRKERRVACREPGDPLAEVLTNVRGEA